MQNLLSVLYLGAPASLQPSVEYCGGGAPPPEAARPCSNANQHEYIPVLAAARMQAFARRSGSPKTVTDRHLSVPATADEIGAQRLRKQWPGESRYLFRREGANGRLLYLYVARYRTVRIPPSQTGRRNRNGRGGGCSTQNGGLVRTQALAQSDGPPGGFARVAEVTRTHLRVVRLQTHEIVITVHTNDEICSEYAGTRLNGRQRSDQRPIRLMVRVRCSASNANCQVPEGIVCIYTQAFF